MQIEHGATVLMVLGHSASEQNSGHYENFGPNAGNSSVVWHKNEQLYDRSDVAVEVFTKKNLSRKVNL